MKLYYGDGSTACRPVVVLAAEAGVVRDIQPVTLFAGDHLSPEYTASNATRLGPMLADGDFRLTVRCRRSWPLAAGCLNRFAASPDNGMWRHRALM